MLILEKVFDVTKPETFYAIESLLQTVNSEAENNPYSEVLKVIVANKVDLPNRLIFEDEIEVFPPPPHPVGIVREEGRDGETDRQREGGKEHLQVQPMVQPLDYLIGRGGERDVNNAHLPPLPACISSTHTNMHAHRRG